MKNVQLFESFVENINEAEKGLMHKLLDIPQDKKISDVYKSGDVLATDLLRAVKNSKIVPVKDIRRKATSIR